MQANNKKDIQLFGTLSRKLGGLRTPDTNVVIIFLHCYKCTVNIDFHISGTAPDQSSRLFTK